MDLDETRYSTKSAADSALRLLQHGCIEEDDDDPTDSSSSSSENDVSWIAAAATEPRRYRKNLGAAFEQAEQPPPPSQNIHNSKQMNHVVSMEDAPPQQAFVSQHAENVLVEPKPTNLSTANSNNTIAVFLRTRPSSDATNTMEIVSPTTSTSSSNDNSDVLPRRIRTRAPPTSNAMKYARGVTTIAKEYEFTGVLGPHVSQQSVYEHTVQPLLDGLLVPHSPQSALAFVYGITNAGKTHTHMGGCAATASAITMHNDTSTEWGLAPRTMCELWQRVTQNNNHNHSGVERQELQLSYYEIYNEQQNDLLFLLQQQTSLKNPYPWLSSSHTNSSSECVVRHTVTSLEDGLKQLFQAQKQRRSAANGINAVSSRSHAICEFTIVTTTTATVSASTSASLWLVDLAGSERTKRTAGQRWQETVQINKSLMTLNRCLLALRQQNSSNGVSNNNKVQPPYRESKLTQLFGKHWTSHHSASRTVMIVNVNPSASDFDETQHALTYASAARTVRVGGGNNSICSNNNTLDYGYDGRRRVAAAAAAAEPTVDKSNRAGGTTSSTGTRAGSVAGQCLQKIKAVVQMLSPKKKNPTDYRGKRMQMQQHEQPKRMRVGKSPTHLESSGNQNSGTHKVTKDLHSAQVRCELLDEMDGQMKAMKLHPAPQLPSSSSAMDTATAVAAAARAQVTVAELMETVQECEDEMVRMRERHAHELARQQSKHERVLRDKNLQLQRQHLDLHQLEQKVQALSLDLAAALSRGQASVHANSNSQIGDDNRYNVDQIQNLQKQLQAKEEAIAVLQRRVAELEEELTTHHFDSETQKATLRHDVEQLTTELEQLHASSCVSSKNQNKDSMTTALLQQQACTTNTKTVLGDSKDALNRLGSENCSNLFHHSPGFEL